MLPAMSASTYVERSNDHENLLRELARNKVDVLEIVREALANAKDHLATNVWIRTAQIKERDRQRVDILLINDAARAAFVPHRERRTT
jgi:hypothetical protein